MFSLKFLSAEQTKVWESVPFPYVVGVAFIFSKTRPLAVLIYPKKFFLINPAIYEQKSWQGYK